MPPAIGAGSALTITDVEVFPTSFAVPPERRVRLGVGEAVKRDAVVVTGSTAGGLTGWGESHHGRAPGTVAHLLRSVLRPLALGRDAADVSGLWREVFRRQIAAMGLGTATVIAHSGLDMALWDLRAALEEDAGWFEADASAHNRFRDELVHGLPVPGAEGSVRPPEGPGLGITVDEDFLRAHPCIDGPAYV